MSVFSILKRGRQAAKEHSAKQAEKDKQESEKAPYKHVPTHAAVDALSGAPSSWKHDDRARIVEAHRRRSALAASGGGLGYTTPMPMNPVHMGMPRTNSALSHVSYPSVYANPVVPTPRVPRAYSYSSVQPTGWSHHGGEVVYTTGHHGAMSLKGKEVERVAMVDSGRASRTSSKANSPVGSSSNSTSSEDDLEMKPVKHTSSGESQNAEAKPVQAEHHHRLHPSSRRISDPPAMNGHLPHSRGSTTSANYRPAAAPRALSTPAAAGIPPVPALPPMQFGSLAGSVTPVTGSGATAASSLTVVHNVATPSPVPSLFGTATPTSVAEEPEADYFSSQTVGTAITTPNMSHKSLRTSKTTRFTELERINSNVEPRDLEPVSPYVETAKLPTAENMPALEKSRVRMEARALPTEFDQTSFGPVTPQESAPAPQKTGKLSKSSKSPGAKLPKKNRWSFRSSKATAVAF